MPGTVVMSADTQLKGERVPAQAFSFFANVTALEHPQTALQPGRNPPPEREARCAPSKLEKVWYVAKMSSVAAPVPWTQTFEVRAHDLDNTGKVSPVALIRLAETQRWRAFAGPLRGMFARAVVRSQSIAIYHRPGFGQELHLAMWVARVGRTSALFGHTVSTADRPDEVAAEMSVTAVATGKSGRPEPVGDLARQLVLNLPTLEAVRSYPDCPGSAYRHQVTVQHHDLDLLQHINQARYVDLVNSARHAAAAQAGYGAHFDGARACKRMDLAYDDEARMEAPLSAYTWAVGPDRVAVELRRDADNRIITRAQLDLERGSRKPTPTPQLVWQDD